MNRIIKTVQVFNFGLVVLLAFSTIFWSRIYLPESLIFLGRLHPVVLHLPIGLFFICFLFLPLKKYIEDKSADELQRFLLELTTMFALLSAQIGMLLAIEDGYTIDNIADHKNAALVFAFGLFLFTSFYQYIKPMFHWVGLGILGIVLTFAGHNGAVITHGEDFLFPTTGDDLAMLDPNIVSVYDWAIEPILKKKCQSCHNKRKSKGELLLMDSLTMMHGGENGAVFIHGKSAESKVIQLVELPIEDDDHMPPNGKPQLTQQEIQLIRHWIDEGLSFSKKLVTYNSEGSFAQLLNQIIDDKKNESYAFESADPDLINRISSPFLSIRPLAAGSPALDVSFYVASSFDKSQLSSLSQIKDQIVSLSLINMPIHDNDLADLVAYENLEKLNLNGTSITNEGLSKLVGLDKLKSLSLTGTKVDLPEDNFFKQWPSLQQLYLSDTKIAYDAIESIQSQYPTLSIYSTKPSEELSILSPPIIRGGKTIYDIGQPLAFSQRINGAEIIYTLDGSEPDSINGTKYNEPLSINKAFDIKAITRKVGWGTSPVATYHVYTKGIPPSEVNQSTTANVKYPGQGPKTVIDGEKASVTNLIDPRWIGFLEEKYISQFTFDDPKPISQISFAYGLQVPAYVFPPTEITVFAGNSINTLKQIANKKLPKITPEQTDQVNNEVVHIALEGEAYKYYKVIAQNLPRIPNWHPGKGQKGWLFIDEIFFYE